MRVRWFGSPWPSEEKRAPICEEDQFRVSAPVGRECIECGKRIEAKDRGVVTSCSPSIWGSWTLEVDEGSFSVCAYHLRCFLAEVVGGEMSGKLMARMNRQSVRDDYISPPSEPQDVVVGRGWKKTTEDDQ